MVYERLTNALITPHVHSIIIISPSMINRIGVLGISHPVINSWQAMHSLYSGKILILSSARRTSHHSFCGPPSSSVLRLSSSCILPIEAAMKEAAANMGMV